MNISGAKKTDDVLESLVKFPLLYTFSIEHELHDTLDFKHSIADASKARVLFQPSAASSGAFLNCYRN
jgi:hypothetical protein